MPVILQVYQRIGFNPCGKSNIRWVWSDFHIFKDRDHAQSYLELNWDLKGPLEGTEKWRVVPQVASAEGPSSG